MNINERKITGTFPNCKIAKIGLLNLDMSKAVEIKTRFLYKSSSYVY